MSETYRQQPFGQPTFIEAPASGSSSGHDRFDILDASTFYHEDEYQGHRLHPLQIPSSQEEYVHGQQFVYASHGSGVSLPGKRTPLFILSLVGLHMLDIHIIAMPVPLSLSIPCSWWHFQLSWVAGLG